MNARASRASRTAPPPAARAVPSGAWRDSLFVAAGWTLLAALVSRGHLVVAYDSFRDMAYSHGILRGELGRDPTLPGLPAWYTPAQPLLAAAVSKLTGVPVPAVHGTSVFWFGWLEPLSILLLVRRAFGRAAAWWSLATIGLGSYWWLTHAAMPMPSIQGVVPGAFTLLAWTAARVRGVRAAVGVGLLGALALAFHPICGGMAMSAILLHGVLGAVLARGEAAAPARQVARQALVAFATWSVLGAAILWPVLGGPILNPEPRLWFGPQLRDPRFVFHLHAPLVLLLGLVGLVRTGADWARSGWLVGYAAVGLMGTLAGYGAVLLGWPVPYLLPHEFQWHLHLAWCIAAAVVLIESARRLGRRWGGGPAARRAFAALLGALALGPALPHLPQATSQIIRLDGHWAPARAIARDLQARGANGAVIACEPETGYFLSGLIGSRALLLPGGHLNPRADVPGLLGSLRPLLQADDEAAFRDALARSPVRFLLQVPRDTSQLRRLRQRYRDWSVLVPVPLADSTLLLYSVREIPPAPGALAR